MATPSTTKHPTPAPARAAQKVGEAEMLELILHKPATRRTVDPSLVLGKPVAGVTVGVDLFASRNFDELASLDRGTRAYLTSTAVPLDLPLKRGVYLVPKQLHGEIQATLEAKLGRRRGLIRKFLAEYDALLDAFLGTFSTAKRDAAKAFFPSKAELKHAFRVEKKLTRWDDFVAHLWHDAAHHAQAVLRAQFSDLMRTFEHSLGRTSSGHKRPVYESTVAQICHFLDTYDRRTLVADPQLQTMVSRAREIFLCGEQEKFLAAVRRNDERRRDVGDQTGKLVAEARSLLAETSTGEQEEQVH